MGKGFLFFCCSCCILVLTIVNFSIGPNTSGTVKKFFNDGNWGTLNCERLKDLWDEAKDDPSKTDDDIKYKEKYNYEACQKKKGKHDMEYTSFIFDIVIGFVCGLIGLLHLFDHKKVFVSNTGLIGLICGVVGFAFTFVYVVFNGLVYNTVYVNNGPEIFKRDGDYAIAEKDGDNFKCFYYDHKKNINSIYAKISDLGKKQYNYDKDGIKDYEKVYFGSSCSDNANSIAIGCFKKERLTILEAKELTGHIYDISELSKCNMIYISYIDMFGDMANETPGIENKDLSDRFLTALILSLMVCLANIGLALFGFLLFRTPGDF